MLDFAATAGNPAHAIKTEYNRLMAIDCHDTLKSEALSLVKEGQGISPKNAEKFRRVVATEPTVARLRSYLTNFVLAASGLSVIKR